MSVKYYLRQIVALALPLTILSASSTVCLFFNRAFIARVSPELLQACTLGYSFISIFQLSTIKMAADAQVFISQAVQTKQYEKVGVFLWQMIWLSLLSMVVILPLGRIIAEIGFDSSMMQQAAKNYFMVFVIGNCVFPLSTALSAFYIGRNRTSVLLLLSSLLVVSQITVGYVAIGGMPPYIPQLGLHGAALSILLPQFVLCLVLFTLILRKGHREKYATHRWQIHPKAIWRTFRVGAFNGFSCALIASIWMTIVKVVMSLNSEDYRIILAFGNSLSYLFTFLTMGFGQAFSILVSGMIGLHKWDEIWIAVKALVVIFASVSLLLIPSLIFYPDSVITFFFPDYRAQFSPELVDALVVSCALLWFFQITEWVDRLARCLLTAAGDTIFMFLMYVITMTIGALLPIYLLIVHYHVAAKWFWLLILVTIAMRNIPFYLRIAQQRWRFTPPVTAYQ